MIMKRRYAFLLALVIAALALGERGGGKGGKGGERGQPELCDFPETLASAEALPGICLGVNDVSSPASLAT